MKRIEVQVPASQVDTVEDLISDYKVKSSHLVLSNGESLFILKIEDSESNDLLYELRARGVGDVFGHISVMPISLYLTNKTAITKIKKSAAANLEEILADLEDSAVLSVTYVTLVILSGTLAALGLVGNSVVTIIGSMIVAPLMGPIALTSIGVLLPRRGILQRGLAAETVGLGATIAMGIIVGLLLGFPDGVTPEMLSRASQTDIINIAFAVVSGAAAGVIISRGQGLSIVGVAIAASLAPPAANIGLFLSRGDVCDAKFAAALLFMNILAINISCSVIFSIYRLPVKAGVSKRHITKTQRQTTVFTVITGAAFIAVAVYIYVTLSGTTAC